MPDLLGFRQWSDIWNFITIRWRVIGRETMRVSIVPLFAEEEIAAKV
jgi:hypothetical protein